MPQRATSEPITIRTAKVAEIDALAGAVHRAFASRAPALYSLTKLFRTPME